MGSHYRNGALRPGWGQTAGVTDKHPWKLVGIFGVLALIVLLGVFFR